MIYLVIFAMMLVLFTMSNYGGMIICVIGNLIKNIIIGFFSCFLWLGALLLIMKELVLLKGRKHV